MKRQVMPSARSVDELLHHWPAVVRAAENDWSRSFATSIARQSRRRGWEPSPKQAAIMREMVNQLFAEAGDVADVQLVETPWPDEPFEASDG